MMHNDGLKSKENLEKTITCKRFVSWVRVKRINGKNVGTSAVISPIKVNIKK